VATRASDIVVVHIVWAPFDPAMLEGFVAAYREREAGIDHRLAVVLNGFRGPSDRRLGPIQRLLEGLDHEQLLTPAATLDLTAYHFAAEEITARQFCFLNSSSRPLVVGWLSLLAKALSDSDVGLTGTCGSYESAYTSAPFFLRRRRRADFPPFPNPHLRSSGFMLERDLLLDLEWPALPSKPAAWALESGKRSISRQVWERGLDVRVVGRDGVAYPRERWRESATFRSGNQRNLLIADNRTGQYETARPARKRRLEEMAWEGSA
jgi:hypothetical protein